ncbi:hypothetical protein N431DRAFT_431533 [Stipitochalara longipes BDJ]|nr:hypothetical protein N431DRAFT_431533 [Stipitochalara longipes BDJ]
MVVGTALAILESGRSLSLTVHVAIPFEDPPDSVKAVLNGHMAGNMPRYESIHTIHTIRHIFHNKLPPQGINVS